MKALQKTSLPNLRTISTEDLKAREQNARSVIDMYSGEGVGLYISVSEA